MPDKPGNGILEVAAFADAGRDRGTTSTGATPQTSATERPEFHLAQPAAECVSSQNSGGRNSVQSEGRLEAQDMAGEAAPLACSRPPMAKSMPSSREWSFLQIGRPTDPL